jgi:copper homeostasis protein
VTAGARGLVFGYLDPAGELDPEALTIVRAAAGPGVGLTFHRAFDRLADPPGALAALAGHGVERVLTSGGKSTAREGQAALRTLVPLVARRGLTIMAGGGLTPENVADLVAATGVREVHFGAGVHDPPFLMASVSRKRVIAVRQALSSVES